MLLRWQLSAGFLLLDDADVAAHFEDGKFYLRNARFWRVGRKHIAYPAIAREGRLLRRIDALDRKALKKGGKTLSSDDGAKVTVMSSGAFHREMTGKSPDPSGSMSDCRENGPPLSSKPSKQVTRRSVKTIQEIR
ncbi:hypothetical protein N1937_27230 (plasmid) [Rhizobium sp. WSM4643]|nr:hypothetical protein N1937_27230 [Rhizobium leguminosarum bv. viciae]